MIAHIEALIFCAQEPISVLELHTLLQKMEGDIISIHQIEYALQELIARYTDSNYAIEIVAVAGGYRFLTKPAHKPVIDLALQEQAKRKLSPSALETLSIISYRQPCTKAEIEQIRGVASDYALLKLMERNLIEMSGRKDAPGRPVLYVTTSRFLEHIGLHKLADLPPLPAPAEAAPLL
jgi:segregation and condensation protein B